LGGGRGDAGVVERDADWRARFRDSDRVTRLFVEGGGGDGDGADDGADGGADADDATLLLFRGRERPDSAESGFGLFFSRAGFFFFVATFFFFFPPTFFFVARFFFFFPPAFFFGAAFFFLRFVGRASSFAFFSSAFFWPIRGLFRDGFSATVGLNESSTNIGGGTAWENVPN
jgi:hypothetical protein